MSLAKETSDLIEWVTEAYNKVAAISLYSQLTCLLLAHGFRQENMCCAHLYSIHSVIYGQITFGSNWG